MKTWNTASWSEQDWTEPIQKIDWLHPDYSISLVSSPGEKNYSFNEELLKGGIK